MMELAPGAWLLPEFALPQSERLWREIQAISAAAPFRHMITPGGFRMSVAMTNCGPLGWVSDRFGYRYSAADPETQRPWPAMPAAFLALATEAARTAGYSNFAATACLINRYEPGAKMSLHQDKDELDLDQPIVSVSLGLPAVFQFGGLKRADTPARVRLHHGDVVVWGGPSRLRYHGILPLKPGDHSLTGPYRFNLTFRTAA